MLGIGAYCALGYWVLSIGIKYYVLGIVLDIPTSIAMRHSLKWKKIFKYSTSVMVGKYLHLPKQEDPLPTYPVLQ